MKHRTHKDFPSYRFYSEGRIKNKTTNHFIKVKRHMKLINAKGKRRSITVQKYFLPNYSLTYILGKIKGVPLNLPIYPLGKLIRNVGNIILSSLRPYRRRQIIKLGMNWLKNIIYRWVV